MGIEVSGVRITNSEFKGEFNMMECISNDGGYTRGVSLFNYGRHMIVKNKKTCFVEVLLVNDDVFLNAYKNDPDYDFIILIEKDAKTILFDKI